ncbi:MAG TPA: ABC transporter permease [Kouleothrix sp.]|uniref:ABC transporter permease n=1 Tax=Kouleothrix sp. TaxID=2779161 RepID=UPI002BB2B2A9|nr:ABC transporter permease [Kouleothrix sp.]HRC74196.1 ABC transporter permease [Kouleothrix sp.]
MSQRIDLATFPTPEQRPRLVRWLRRGWASLIERQELVVGLLLLLFGVALSFGTSTFFTSTNLLNVALGFSWYAIAAFGAMMVIIVGGIDLSVGAVMALAALISALVLQAGLPLALALLSGALCGALVGLTNGLLVGRTGLPPFMVTLGTMGITRGVALSLTSGAPVLDLSAGFRYLGQADLRLGALSIPLPVVWMALLAALVSFLLHQTVLGRYIYTVGRSERALRVAGISPVRLKTGVYALSGVLAACAGMIMTARLGVAAPMAASGYELDIIAAAVIGGASLFGGEGTVTGVLLGAALIQVVRNGVVLLGLTNQNQWQFVTIGAMILLVLLLDYWRRRRV